MACWSIPPVQHIGPLRIGDLEVNRNGATDALAGQQVTVAGEVIGGVLLPVMATPDLLLTDPGRYFGPAVGVFVVEGFAVYELGHLKLGPAFSTSARSERLDGWPRGRGVFRFERGAAGLQAIDPIAFGSRIAGPHLEPAPVPNRGLRGPMTRGDGGQGRPGRPGGGQRGRLRQDGGVPGPSGFGGLRSGFGPPGRDNR